MASEAQEPIKNSSYDRNGQLYFNDTAKKCPFCGGKAILKIVNAGGKMKYAIGCLNLECLAYPGYGAQLFDTEEEAIKRWNMRHRPLDARRRYYK